MTGLRITIDPTWPKSWTPWLLIRHPRKMYRPVRLWVCIHLLDWMDRKGWERKP